MFRDKNGGLNVKRNTSWHKSDILVKPKRKTVGITLPPRLVEKARERHLNISRITEQALLSIFEYLDKHNDEGVG